MLKNGTKIEITSTNEDIFLYGACFYSSFEFDLAEKTSTIDDDIHLMPVASALKVRKHNTNINSDSNKTEIQSISVTTTPGIASSSRRGVMELGTLLLQSFQEKEENGSSCGGEYPSFSVTVISVNVLSRFVYEIMENGGNVECYIDLLVEYLTRKPQVLSIELVSKTHILNDEAKWIIESSQTNIKPWKDIGITGLNEVVQVVDSGLDENHCYFRDANGVVDETPDFDLSDDGKINHNMRKVIQYVTILGDRKDTWGHGTHTAATVAGKRSNNGVSEVKGHADGIAEGAKIAFFDAHESESDDSKTILIPEVIQSLFYFGMQASARISSNSWGNNVGGVYTEQARDIDTFFYENEDDDFIMIVAAGNDGDDGQGTIGYPGLSKNVIAVGASHSDGKDLYNDMMGMDYMASFSSRGTTADGRIKPDVVAPGHSILSARSGSNGECDPLDRPSFDPNNKEHAGLIFLSGTSMACPVVAGAGALVRQYFLDGRYPTGNIDESKSIDISGTLLKAILINGGEAMVGRSTSLHGSGVEPSVPYDEFQGFGRINLLNSLKHPTSSFNSPDLYVENEKTIQQGQSHKYKFIVCDDHDFRVTTVWRDPPSQSGCSKCLINDLDLEVVLQSGKKFYPNSKTTKDRKNNVERVVLEKETDLPDGYNTIDVQVTATNLGVGNLQKYSLASTGCIDEVDFVSPTPSPVSSCGPKQFEYLFELFTDRKPDQTSWTLEYQGSGGVINSVAAGSYNTMLKKYYKRGCADYGCLIFYIKDLGSNGICCEKGMGSFILKSEDTDLAKGNTFDGRHQIMDFCYNGSEGTDEPTMMPTIVCSDDEFQYSIVINTDMYPDETSWKLLKTPYDYNMDGVCIGRDCIVIDSVPNMYYRNQLSTYIKHGCAPFGCYEFQAFDFIASYSSSPDGLCCYFGNGSYKLFVEDTLIFQGSQFNNWQEFANHNFCQSSASTPEEVPPTDRPTVLVCEADEVEYEIEVLTDFWPWDVAWRFEYESGELIDEIEFDYTMHYYSYQHSGCIREDCYRFIIQDSRGGLCCDYGEGSYKVKLGNQIMTDGGEFELEEIKEFCYDSLRSKERNPNGDSSLVIQPTSPTSLSVISSQRSFISSPLVVCEDDEFFFSFEITEAMEGDTSSVYLMFGYKYPEQAGVDPGSNEDLGSCYEKYLFDGLHICQGCAKYGCFYTYTQALFYKFTTGDFIISQNTEPYSRERFCYYLPTYEEPTITPTVLKEAIFQITISFPVSSVINNNEVSEVVEKSIMKLLYRACTMSYDISFSEIILHTMFTSCNSNSQCVISLQACEVSCVDEIEETETFLELIGNSLGQSILSNVMKQTADHLGLNTFLGVTEINIDFDFEFDMVHGNEYDFTSTPTIAPTECSPTVKLMTQAFNAAIENIISTFFFYTVKLMTQTLNAAIENIISTFFFYLVPGPTSTTGNPTYSPSSQLSSHPSFIPSAIGSSSPSQPTNFCGDNELFKLQIDVITSVYYPAGHNWVLMYSDGILIDSIEEGDYTEGNTTYTHIYCLPKSACFLFSIMIMSLPSYTVYIEEDTIIEGPEPDSALMNEESEFCFRELSCSNEQFRLQIDVITSAFPSGHNWDLMYSDGSLIDSIEEVDYTEGDTTYTHTYCLPLSACFLISINIMGLPSYRVYIDEDTIIEGPDPDSAQMNEENEFCYGSLSPSSSPSAEVTLPLTVTSSPTSSPTVQQCDDDGMFALQIIIMTDTNPNDIDWKLEYADDGTIIESIDKGSYTSENTLYMHHYCLKEGCLSFELFNSLSFCGSYNITSGDIVLASSDEFNWWRDSRRFCYPPKCGGGGENGMFSLLQNNNNNMFEFQIDVATDDWPHETFWELSFADNETIIDSVEQGYYTEGKMTYTHRYCLQDGCYKFLMKDSVGDGLCCSFGAGFYGLKVNNKMIGTGEEVGDGLVPFIGQNETTSFCYPSEDCEGGINSIFGNVLKVLSDSNTDP